MSARSEDRSRGKGWHQDEEQLRYCTQSRDISQMVPVRRDSELSHKRPASAMIAWRMAFACITFPALRLAHGKPERLLVGRAAARRPGGDLRVFFATAMAPVPMRARRRGLARFRIVRLALRATATISPWELQRRRSWRSIN